MKPPISFYFISISSFFPPIAHHLDFGLQFMCKAMATCSMSPRSWPRGQGAYLLQYNKISLILKGGRIPILHSSPIKFSTCIHEIKPKGSPQCNLAQTIFLTWLYPSKISNLWGTMSKNCCIQAYLSSIQHKNIWSSICLWLSRLKRFGFHSFGMRGAFLCGTLSCSQEPGRYACIRKVHEDVNALLLYDAWARDVGLWAKTRQYSNIHALLSFTQH